MTSGKFRFGLFMFDAATRELRREQMLIHLQSQPAQVLGCLIERAGQVVSREELRNAVWGNGTFVDFDRGLNFCITQIRSVLGDDPPNQPTSARSPSVDTSSLRRLSVLPTHQRKSQGRRT